MISKVQTKIQAIALRMEGHSYKEIMEQLPVSKSTLSGWLKYVKLTEEQQKNLEKKIASRSNMGRAKGYASNRNKRIGREQLAYKDAQAIYGTYKTDPLFICGVSLFWAEGGKRTSAFQFMNSDHRMISFMIYWVKKYLSVRHEDISIRLSTHADFINEKYEVFWSDTTGVPLSQFKKTTYKPNMKHGVFKKNPDYKGCARLEVKGGMHLLRVVISLQNILCSDLKMVLL